MSADADNRELHERIHVDTDPDVLTTAAEFRYWGELQRQRAINASHAERAAVAHRDSQAKLTDRFLTILENVTKRR